MIYFYEHAELILSSCVLAFKPIWCTPCLFKVISMAMGLKTLLGEVRYVVYLVL